MTKKNIKECPICQVGMIEVFSGRVLLTYPKTRVMNWFCGCGHQEVSRYIQARTNESINNERWKQENKRRVEKKPSAINVIRRPKND